MAFTDEELKLTHLDTIDEHWDKLIPLIDKVLPLQDKMARLAKVLLKDGYSNDTIEQLEQKAGWLEQFVQPNPQDVSFPDTDYEYRNGISLLSIVKDAFDNIVIELRRKCYDPHRETIEEMIRLQKELLAYLDKLDPKALTHTKADLAPETSVEEKATHTEQEQEPKESMEVSWDKNNLDYMFSSEAIAKFTGSKMPSSTLSKLLKPDNTIQIHYMRKKGVGCKVRVGDFREYAKQKYPPDDITAEFAEGYIADIEARKRQERRKKTYK